MGWRPGSGRSGGKVERRFEAGGRDVVEVVVRARCCARLGAACHGPCWAAHQSITEPAHLAAALAMATAHHRRPPAPGPGQASSATWLPMTPRSG
jgi:hypothetical protein